MEDLKRQSLLSLACFIWLIDAPWHTGQSGWQKVAVILFGATAALFYRYLVDTEYILMIKSRQTSWLFHFAMFVYVWVANVCVMVPMIHHGGPWTIAYAWVGGLSTVAYLVSVYQVRYNQHHEPTV